LVCAIADADVNAIAIAASDGSQRMKYLPFIP